MSNIRPFQIVLLAIFGLLAVLALIFLSVFQSQRKQQEFAYGEKVTVWGTFPQSVFKDLIHQIGRDDKAFNVVQYTQVNPATFSTDLVNAIAEGHSPDVIILKSDNLVTLRTKLIPISYSTISERDFRDTYTDGASFFALEDGIYGIPFAIDPMVMYWNRDMFSSAGLAQAPTTWESIVSDVVPHLTTRDDSRNVLKSGVAFGEFSNIARAKNTLMLLLLQSGSQMVTQNGTQYKVNLDTPLVQGARPPLQAAVQFYTDFSNVNSPLYSWNRAKPTDKDAFLAGDLGLYFGLGSEYGDIGDKNPNLNFDIAMVPQGAGATALRTFADMYAFAIPRAAANKQGAFAVASILANAKNAPVIDTAIGMSSARRDVIAQGDENLYRKIILQSALIARSWLDPNPNSSDAIFKQMIEDVVSNRARISDAASDAVNRLMLAF